MKGLSVLSVHHNGQWRSSRSQACEMAILERKFQSEGYSAGAWTVPLSTNPMVETPLLAELESLDWRIGRLEVAFFSLIRMWTRANRLYRRFGHALLRTPLAGVCHKLMGRIAANEKYARWFLQHRASDPFGNPVNGPAAIQAGGPLLSLIMPVYQPNLAWLEIAVDSVRAQSYRNWQLVIVLDGDPEHDVRTYLQTLSSEDARIQSIYNSRGGISAALNCGLNACVGTYTGFIDQDDILESTALSHIAAAVLNDEPDIVYTDEDYVDEGGKPYLPIFKPAWSPALLLSCMYTGHLLMALTSKAREIGGFRSEYDGAQDYDFVLRLTDKGANVLHIPRVLYHWRRHANSTALSSQAKPHSHAAGSKAVQETLTRRQLRATVHDGPVRHSYRFSKTSSNSDSAAIIVPTRDPKLLECLLKSLHCDKPECRRDVHVVLHCQGNANDEKIAAVARKFGAQVLEYRGPFNFALMNNLAASRVSNRYIVLLNDDIEVHSADWLEQLCAPFVRSEVGITGALLHYPDGMIEHSGVVTGIGDGAGHAARLQQESPFWPWLNMTRNVSAVTGACLAIRRSLFEQLDGFDIRFFNNYNDVDLCLRAQSAGFEVVLSTGARMSHGGSRTRVSGTSLRERLDFWARWATVLGQVDYFYSPNFSRRLETIDLSTPSW